RASGALQSPAWSFPGPFHPPVTPPDEASKRRCLPAGKDTVVRRAEPAAPPTDFPAAAGANRANAPSKGPYQRKAAIVYKAGTLFETLWIESGLAVQAVQVRHPDQSGPGIAILV